MLGVLERRDRISPGPRVTLPGGMKGSGAAPQEVLLWKSLDFSYGVGDSRSLGRGVFLRR